MLVLGATGLVGAAITRQAVQDARVTAVAAVGRRQPPLSDPKLTPIQLRDFSNFDPLAPESARADAVLCALGISWYQAKGEPRTGRSRTTT